MRGRERANEPWGNSFIFRMEIKGLMVKHSSAGYFTGFSIFGSQETVFMETLHNSLMTSRDRQELRGRGWVHTFSSHTTKGNFIMLHLQFVSWRIHPDEQSKNSQLLFCSAGLIPCCDFDAEGKAKSYFPSIKYHIIVICICKGYMKLLQTVLINILNTQL